MSNELSEPKFDPLAQYGRVRNKGRKEHCPVCFKAYELVQTCSCSQYSNICGRCGVSNCTQHN